MTTPTLPLIDPQANLDLARMIGLIYQQSNPTKNDNDTNDDKVKYYFAFPAMLLMLYYGVARPEELHGLDWNECMYVPNGDILNYLVAYWYTKDQRSFKTLTFIEHYTMTVEVSLPFALAVYFMLGHALARPVVDSQLLPADKASTMFPHLHVQGRTEEHVSSQVTDMIREYNDTSGGGGDSGKGETKSTDNNNDTPFSAESIRNAAMIAMESSRRLTERERHKHSGQLLDTNHKRTLGEGEVWSVHIKPMRVLAGWPSNLYHTWPTIAKWLAQEELRPFFLFERELYSPIEVPAFQESGSCVPFMHMCTFSLVMFFNQVIDKYGIQSIIVQTMIGKGSSVWKLSQDQALDRLQKWSTAIYSDFQLRKDTYPKYHGINGDGNDWMDDTWRIINKREKFGENHLAVLMNLSAEIEYRCMKVKQAVIRRTNLSESLRNQLRQMYHDAKLLTNRDANAVTAWLKETSQDIQKVKLNLDKYNQEIKNQSPAIDNFNGQMEEHFVEVQQVFQRRVELVNSFSDEIVQRTTCTRSDGNALMAGTLQDVYAFKANIDQLKTAFNERKTEFGILSNETENSLTTLEDNLVEMEQFLQTLGTNFANHLIDEQRQKSQCTQNIAVATTSQRLSDATLLPPTRVSVSLHEKDVNGDDVLFGTSIEARNDYATTPTRDQHSATDAEGDWSIAPTIDCTVATRTGDDRGHTLIHSHSDNNSK